MRHFILLAALLNSALLMADVTEYTNHLKNFENCKKSVTSSLLESPNFQGEVWVAESRAESSCKNRLGEPPEKFSYMERMLVNNLKDMATKNWDWVQVVSTANEVVEEHITNFLGLETKGARQEAVQALTSFLTINFCKGDYSLEEYIACKKELESLSETYLDPGSKEFGKLFD